MDSRKSKSAILGLERGSAAESTGCSLRGPKLISSTHRWLLTSCHSSTKVFNALPWSLWALHTHSTQTYTQVKHNKINFKDKLYRKECGTQRRGPQQLRPTVLWEFRLETVS